MEIPEILNRLMEREKAAPVGQSMRVTETEFRTGILDNLEYLQGVELFSSGALTLGSRDEVENSLRSGQSLVYGHTLEIVPD